MMKRFLLLAILALALPASASGALNVSASNGRTCAATLTGVDCAGLLNYGSRTKSAVMVPIEGTAGATFVSSGFKHSCALRAGEVICWGGGDFGQLGDGSTADSTAPVKVVGLTDAVQISAGWGDTCAVRASGNVVCWGHNRHGALGDGSEVDSSVPVTVSGISNAVSVAAGYKDQGACALLATGAVRCWGINSYGQLGNGRRGPASLVPVRVKGLSGAVSVSGGMEHSCAVVRSGRVFCWGHGLLGLDTGVPVPVKLILHARSVSVGMAYACAVVAGGRIVCWGQNAASQFGNGTLKASVLPTQSLIAGAVEVSAGFSHTCALLSNGGADCWGSNDYGMLAANFHHGTSLVPLPVVFGPVQAHPPSARKTPKSGAAPLRAP
jgi:alpha-tubulin suppressor-like RCC1 family protein